jgi:phosphoribosylglycinamide formyltransferase 1
MARISIFASGNGSNFEALARSFENDKSNIVVLLLCNNKDAFAFERAKNLSIPFEYVKYEKGDRENAEKRILAILKKNRIDVVFLAGYMKILTKNFLDEAKIPIVNIHPSLLPKYKGVDGIKQAFDSSDAVIGITIHYVVPEVDSGEIIIQKSIPLDRNKGIEGVEQDVHTLEHKWYPEAARMVCDRINNKIK